MAALAALPDEDVVRSFSAHRAKVLGRSAAIAVATPAQLEALCRIVVERVAVRVCPQGGSDTHPLSEDDDPLAWYVA